MILAKRPDIERFLAKPEGVRVVLIYGRDTGVVKDRGAQLASATQISVQFSKDAPIDPLKVILLIQKDRSTKMAGPEKLVRRANLPNLKERVKAVRELLDAVKA